MLAFFSYLRPWPRGRKNAPRLNPQVPDAGTILSPHTQRLNPGTEDGLFTFYLRGNQGLAGSCPRTSNAANKPQSQVSNVGPPDLWVHSGRIQWEHSTDPGHRHPTLQPGATPSINKHKACGLWQVTAPQASSVSFLTGHPEGSMMHKLNPMPILEHLTRAWHQKIC